MNNKQKGISLVLIATVFWGIMGISSRILYEAGLSTMFIALVEAFYLLFAFLFG